MYGVLWKHGKEGQLTQSLVCMMYMTIQVRLTRTRHFRHNEVEIN